MNNSILITIISSLISGLIGIFVSSWFYSKMEKRKLKLDTVRRLLGYRYHIKSEGFSTALNEAVFIFADNQEVAKAIEELHTCAITPGQPDIDNKLLSLFKAVCKDTKCLPKNMNDTYLLQAFNIIK